MTNTTRSILIVAILVILGLAAYTFSANSNSEPERVGTEMRSAEEVIDLELEAQAQYEAAGGQYE